MRNLIFFSLRSLYTALWLALLPFVLFRLFWRAQRAPDYRKRILERFGYYNKSYAAGGIWLHTVSVGELMAARPLIMRLKAEFPDLPLTITTMTPTGSAQVTKNFPDVQHVYLPYDYPFALKRFIKTFKPKLGIIMETEIWPNLFYSLHQAHIPFIIANARLAEKSYQGYKRAEFFFAPFLRMPSCIAAQSESDADHFKKLGVLQKQVMVMGNIKYDVALPDAAIARAKPLRTVWARPVWIASSTHAQEEDFIIKTAMAIKSQHPDTLCIIAPRHPERFEAVAQKCITQGLNIARYSQHQAVDNKTDVLIADTLGELYFFYALSDIAVVCGSFTPRGGHNILEPALLSLPIIVGPHMFHFKTIMNDFLAKEAVLQVADEESLLPALLELLAHPETAKQLGSRAHAQVLANQGALDKLWDVVGKQVIRK